MHRFLIVNYVKETNDFLLLFLFYRPESPAKSEAIYVELF